LEKEARAIETAVGTALESGLRTADLVDSGKLFARTAEAGTAIVGLISQ
jgi:hypothetical protein